MFYGLGLSLFSFLLAGWGDRFSLPAQVWLNRFTNGIYSGSWAAYPKNLAGSLSYTHGD